MNTDYLDMRAHFYPRESEGRVRFRLDELAAVWKCSSKQAKRKLKKLDESGCCSYVPGRGRGNCSEIRFRSLFQDDLDAAIRHSLLAKNMDLLMHILQLPCPKQWSGQLLRPIHELLGLQAPDPITDVLQAIVTLPVTNLDPAQASVTYDLMLVSLIGDTLLRYDAKRDQLLPHLAAAWETDADCRTWTVYLRKQVRFHHRRPLTSGDVKFSLERLMRPDCANRWLTEDIGTVDCMNPLTVRIVLKRPNPLFGRFLAAAPTTIVAEDTPVHDKHFTGTGPYMLTECNRLKAVLEAFDDYFGLRPYIDTVQFWHMRADAAHQIGYRLAGIGAQSEAMRNGDEGGEIDEVAVEERIEQGFRFLLFNTRHAGLMQDRALRHAIHELCDVEAMWRDLGRSGLVPASHFIPGKSKPFARSLRKARHWLAQSGYKGQEVHLSLLDLPAAWEEGLWLKRRAARIGLNLVLHPYALDELYDSSAGERMDLSLSGYVSTHDPLLSMMGAFHNPVLPFRKWMASEHIHPIDGMLEQMKEAAPLAGEALGDNIIRYLHDNMLLVFLYHPRHWHRFDLTLRHIQFDPFAFPDVTALWVRPAWTAEGMRQP
ncbi:ABC transporter substrate-binding protein [Paenibacillus thiaminolyticus]|uniref:ABC transporter substrate-binding protein n=1 Tax=Paenibacillus thiaminolyticus TaxID=49283 RepID=A0AAP9J289_PANTH|nr:ABC transporter substrate-binding protein [Paenibacillus thiaminolyticus]MCY9535755.1 ABC transporter substrate-binding protein [Paenibacillus thiaminolyticus]MCY9601053.1 ABC transporter substrate-binding protein [Paenibacillus thiaminolyticus]MCY9609498.1 ABC transporter substrate-binding protein [Paenibacillus thiaminolyticus]MCY9613228.1 ABC transporter substrate-binding protein [Paenibacillus thiaminolyticus]MCY9617643.1 ABC transporter substrate-binding protein [Paenibacillus thiamino